MQTFRYFIGCKKWIAGKGGWNHRPLRWLTPVCVDSTGKGVPVFGIDDSH